MPLVNSQFTSCGNYVYKCLNRLLYITSIGTNISAVKQPEFFDILPTLTVVLLYILLYKAFFGFVINPRPLGALILLLMTRFKDSRDDILLLKDGVLIPNFIKLPSL